MKTVRTMCRLTAISLIVLASIGQPLASMTTGTVRGAVTRAGSPVVGARVMIESASDSAFGATAHTDQAGAFSFSETPVGEVIVRAYDAHDALLVTGRGVLEGAGEVIVLQLEVP